MTRELPAIESLFRARRGFLLRLLTRRLGNADQAEDVLQEAFIQYQGAAASQTITNPEGFLVTVASNLAVDHIRRDVSRRAREHAWSDLSGAGRDFEGMPIDGAPPPDREIDAKFEVEHIIAQMKELSPQVRRAFILHKFDGLSHQETAERMGLSRSTIEKHIMKAMKYLMSQIGHRS